MAFALIFAPVCILDEYLRNSLHHSTDFGQSELTNVTDNCVVYDGHRIVLLQNMISIQSEDIKTSLIC